MAGNIPQSFQKLYDYIEGRKTVDANQDDNIDEINEKIVNLNKKIDDKDVNFSVYYDLLTITKGQE